MKIFIIPLLLVFAGQAMAETLVATRTIRSQSILSSTDVAMIQGDVPGTLQLPQDAIGMEARVVLYAGRPIRVGDIGPPAIVERNQIVTLYFRRGPLTIAADARAMDRGGVGDLLRVINLASRNTVTGVVHSDGTVRVGGPDTLALK